MYMLFNEPTNNSSILFNSLNKNNNLDPSLSLTSDILRSHADELALNARGLPMVVLRFVAQLTGLIEQVVDLTCCAGLTNITIPDSVTEIGRGAFYGCIGLTGIVIPKSVTMIEPYAFTNCIKLQSVEILGRLCHLIVELPAEKKK